MKRKVTKRSPIPIWLRKLEKVREELRGFRWPSEREGFYQALALMKTALFLLRTDPRRNVMQEMLEWQKADRRWIDRWRKERGAFLP